MNVENNLNRENPPVDNPVTTQDINGDVEEPTPFEKIYQERRNLIKTPDKELLKFAIEKGANFGDSETHLAINYLVSKFWKKDIEDKPIFDPDKEFLEISEKLQKHLLVDIGSGGGAAYYAKEMMKWLNVKEVVSVDPFREKCFMDKDREKEAKNLEKESVEAATLLRGSKFYQKDGLSYLLDDDSPNGNILICNLEHNVVPNDEYLQRLAQEAFRTLPDDGVLIVMDSPEVQAEARALFPFSRRAGSLFIFEKTRKNESDKK